MGNGQAWLFDGEFGGSLEEAKAKAASLGGAYFTKYSKWLQVVGKESYLNPEAPGDSSAVLYKCTSAEDVDAAAADEKPQVSEYAKWMDGASSTLTEAGSEEKPQVSEYAKWMDGAAASEESADAKGDDASEQAAEAEPATKAEEEEKRFQPLTRKERPKTKS